MEHLTPTDLVGGSATPLEALALEASQPGQPWESTWQSLLARRDVLDWWQEAFVRLGRRFPARSQEEQAFIRGEVGRLTPGRRDALRSLSELIAALEDPRWAAEQTLGSRSPVSG